MKKVLKILGIIVGSVLLLALGGFSFIQFKPLPTYEVNAPDLKVELTEARLDHGAKLVHNVCGTCHLAENNTYEGRLIYDDPQLGLIYSSNITQDNDFGIGKYTDGELYQLLRTGIKRDGKLSLPMMYLSKHISDEDLYSMIAFLRSDHPSVLPSEKLQPKFEQTFLTRMLFTVAWKPLPLPEGLVVAPDPADRIAYGKYLVQTQQWCSECHSASFETNNLIHPDSSLGYLGGGAAIVDVRTGENIISRNITMDPETGIGTWSEEDFITAVKWGMRKNGQAVRWPMKPFTNLDTTEILSIFEYLKTVPVIHNPDAAASK